jgi:hypothetical protein
LIAASLAACLLLVSCSDNESPSSIGPSTPPPVVNPLILDRLVLEGNVVLTTVGETSQLKATAVYSNGSSADVSSQAIWNSVNFSSATTWSEQSWTSARTISLTSRYSGLSGSTLATA